MICPNTTPSAYLENTTISGHELYHAGTRFIEAQLKIWEEFLDQNEEEAKRIPSMFSTGWLLHKIHDERLTRLRDLCFDYSRVPQQERADIVKEFLFSGPTLPDPELLQSDNHELVHRHIHLPDILRSGTEAHDQERDACNDDVQSGQFHVFMILLLFQ